MEVTLELTAYVRHFCFLTWTSCLARILQASLLPVLAIFLISASWRTEEKKENKSNRRSRVCHLNRRLTLSHWSRFSLHNYCDSAHPRKPCDNFLLRMETHVCRHVLHIDKSTTSTIHNIHKEITDLSKCRYNKFILNICQANMFY